jgi:hypothetical protein
MREWYMFFLGRNLVLDRAIGWISAYIIDY